MIVAHVSDPYLRVAVCLAAHPEEDVILDHELATEAMESGHPRLVLQVAAGGSAPDAPVGPNRGPRVVWLTRSVLAGWEAERRRQELPAGRADYLADRLRELIEKQASEVTWVDRALGDLGRAAGASLPPELRAFGRRILEFPSYYTDLRPLADACKLSRGALKARFRRRSLPSPYTYLRWFRLIATANLLADRSVTVAQAAHRIGFTSDGNLCRSVRSLTGLTPTEIRTVQGWNRLLITFAWQHLRSRALDGWGEMGDLFERHVA